MAKSAQDEWNNRKQRLQQKFAEEAQSVITAYAKTKGYSIILEKQICLYNADALDITNEVIRAMNAKYPGTGSGGAKN
ncbi:MAG: OmpH family outer membrane protein, partial [Acidobacteriota bacterium]